MKALLAEDDEPKRRNLETHLRTVIPDIEIISVASVRSAIDVLRKEFFDLLILDMSLPTFDISKDEPGGRPQSAGGVEVLDFLLFSERSMPTLIVTQHEAFDFEGAVVSLEELVSKLSARFGQNFRGLVQYNTISGTWKSNLSELLEQLWSRVCNEYPLN